MRKKKMESAYYCMLVLMTVRVMRATEGRPLADTGNSKGNPEGAPSLQKNVVLDTKTVSAVSGEEVTLVVDAIKEGEIQDIQWVKNGVNFATTRPYEDVSIRESRYEGRLRGSSNGSLIIHNVTMEDQGEYKADVFMLSLKNYEIIYILTISEERGSHGTHMVAIVIVLVLLLSLIAAGAAYKMRRKSCFNNKSTNQESKRSDPEGSSEQKELHLKMSISSPENDPDEENNDEDDEEFVDAPESLDEETKGGHASSLESSWHPSR